MGTFGFSAAGVVTALFAASFVVALANEPAEDARRIGRRRLGGIEDAGVVSLAVQRGDVVARDRAPVALAACDLCPALNAGEQALDAGAVAMDYEPWGGRVVLEPCSVRRKDRDQVFGAGEDVDVGFISIAILRQPFVRLPGHGRN